MVVVCPTIVGVEKRRIHPPMVSADGFQALAVHLTVYGCLRVVKVTACSLHTVAGYVLLHQLTPYSDHVYMGAAPCQHGLAACQSAYVHEQPSGKLRLLVFGNRMYYTSCVGLPRTGTELLGSF
jgi:hypothetical protein